MITVKHSPTLKDWLSTCIVDGGTVDSLLFDGGRLSYPGRQEIEVQLGMAEPYTLDHEARTIEGLSRKVQASIRLLSAHATRLYGDSDHTLHLLWEAHMLYPRPLGEGPSLDRLIAALVMVQMATTVEVDADIDYASVVLITALHAEGFSPSSAAIEELCDGAPPASVGLGLVDIDWVET